MSVDGSVGWRTVHRCVLSNDPQRARLYVRGADARSRTRARVDDSGEVSFATYFGAFPVGYWRAHGDVTRARMSLRTSGSARVEIRRTDRSGAVHAATSLETEGGDCALEVPVGPDDAWVWGVVAGPPGTEIDDVRWAVPDVPARAVTLTVAVTTFDREDECIRLLERLGAEAQGADVIDRVVVVDQGTRRLVEADGFERASALFSDGLEVLVQPNLGGSGGFSRGMATAVKASSSHVLLLDDDVDLEPESLRRLADFAAFTRDPSVVGAQMLSLVEPTRLHSFGERIDRRWTWWEPIEPSLAGLDVGSDPVESVPAFSHVIDADFNGWWMCLIPTSLIRRTGAALPLFIKWDDAEFGLRARAHAVPTVTLPGAALWHMPWTAKDDGLDWQAYFQLRNRVVTALLHTGPGVIRASFVQDVNHVLCGQYGSIAVRNQALVDVLSGPGHLDSTLRAGPARPNEILDHARQRPLEASVAPPTVDGSPFERPTGARESLVRALEVARTQVRRTRARPLVPRLRRDQGKWWALGVLDGAVVQSATGEGVYVVRRDRAMAWHEISRALVLRWRLRLSWTRLAREYRRAAPGLASLSTWEDRFESPPRAEP